MARGKCKAGKFGGYTFFEQGSKCGNFVGEIFDEFGLELEHA